MDDEQEKASSDPRPGFMVSRDSALALSRKTVHTRGVVMTAMIEYFLYGEVRTKLNEVCQTLFDMIQPGMDRDKDNYEKKKLIYQENGKKGGRPRKETLNSDPETTPKNQKNQLVFEKTKKTHKHKQEHKHEQEHEQEQEHKQEQKLVSAACAATNELKIRMENFRDQCRTYVGKYDHDMVENFYYFWSEPQRESGKMRFELEKTWSIDHRLRAWKSRQTPSKGSAKPAPKTALQTMSEADIDAQQEARDREDAKRKKDAISYPEHLRIVALEKQGYACDEKGNVLGVKKELEAQGWVFDEWGRVKERPK